MKTTGRISNITLLSPPLDSTQVQSIESHTHHTHVSASKAGPVPHKGATAKVDPSTYRPVYLVNKLLENFLLLSLSSVLRETGLSERVPTVGKMVRRSQ